MRTWDDRNQRFSFTYDLLRRPLDRTVSVGGAAEQLLSRILYGDQLPASPEATNHRGRVYRAYDGAGVATTLAFDFKGQPTSEQRQLVSSKTTRPDWSALLGQSTIADMATAAASLLDAETFSASSNSDALGRVLTAISPDNSEALYTYDQGGALQKVELKHRGSTTAQTVVGDITYNPRGQRKSVVYGPTSSPTTTTSYSYDPQTYRLAHLSTIRGSDSQALQGLHYHYDPVGNITDIRDSAQQTVYFQNAVVDAANTYKYDAVYRLIEATGREHSTQGTTQRTHEQLPTGPQPMTSDPSAMWQYTQKYTYDSVGNILKMQHISGSSWTRYYEYAANGNRLEKTSAPGDPANGPYTHAYSYDAHGSMTVMPHLPSMVWDVDDQLQNAVAGTQSVWFQYAGGIRSRKYTESTTGSETTEERIYLGSWEVYRKRVGVGQTLDVERESLHISDGSGRICLVETKTFDGTAVVSPVGVWRYQLGNHLGSAATEVDANGAVISYEEYHPYGTSAYRAVDASVEVSAKRYRYTGMERDEETGLAYHSARYLAPWLGIWASSDPFGIQAGPNRFRYGNSSPIVNSDLSGLIPPSDTVSSENLVHRNRSSEHREQAIEATVEREPDFHDVPSEAHAALGGLTAGAEIALGVTLLLAPDPSMATKIAGVALILKGIDTGRSSIQTGAQGEVVPTTTEEIVVGVLPELGVPEAAAVGVFLGIEVIAGSIGPDDLAKARLSISSGDELAEGGVRTTRGGGGAATEGHQTATAVELGDTAAKWTRQTEGFHGASGNEILGIIETGGFRPNQNGEVFLGGSAGQTFAQGADASRGASFSIEVVVGTGEAGLVRKMTPGVPDTTVINTAEAVPAHVSRMHVRRWDPDEEEFTIEVVEGADAIKSYLRGE